MRQLPCTTRLDVYDALFDDEAPEQQAAAHRVAVRLCGSCPAPCDQKVTSTSTPRVAEELPELWLPATTEGRAEFTGRESWHGRPYALRVHGCQCQRCSSAHQPGAPIRAPRVTWPKSTAYIRPADRISASATEAAGLAAKGMTVQQIADLMCVTVPTAEALLRLAITAAQLAA